MNFLMVLFLSVGAFSGESDPCRNFAKFQQPPRHLDAETREEYARIVGLFTRESESIKKSEETSEPIEDVLNRIAPNFNPKLLLYVPKSIEKAVEQVIVSMFLTGIVGYEQVPFRDSAVFLGLSLLKKSVSRRTRFDVSEAYDLVRLIAEVVDEVPHDLRFFIDHRFKQEGLIHSTPTVHLVELMSASYDFVAHSLIWHSQGRLDPQGLKRAYLVARLAGEKLQYSLRLRGPGGRFIQDALLRIEYDAYRVSPRGPCE